MAVTTVPAIRAQLVTVIEGLTPTRLTNLPFRRADQRQTLAEWASRNSGKCRAFEIVQTSSGVENEFTHPSQVLREEPFSLTVAYPRLASLAGAGDLDGLRDMMREDARVLRDAVFDSSNYLSGVCKMGPAVASFSEDGEVWFVQLDFVVTFFETQSI